MPNSPCQNCIPFDCFQNGMTNCTLDTVMSKARVLGFVVLLNVVPAGKQHVCHCAQRHMARASVLQMLEAQAAKALMV